MRDCRLATLFLAFLFAVTLQLAPAARADEFKPAYLELKQTGLETFEVLWKVPALDESTTLAIRPQFPAGAVETAPRRARFAAGASVQRWAMRMPGGMADMEVGFPDLMRLRIDVLVRLIRIDGTVQVARILPSEPRFVVRASPAKFDVARTYTVLGIEHILLGIDHLLFVLSLLLLVKGSRRLLLTITAFTLAHSLTLALASIGILNVAVPPVEALIALSIVFVAREILNAQRGKPGFTHRYPWLIAFAFGLLHGLGFASALAEVGLPPLSVTTALLFFNIGVEIGQLLFVAVIMGLIRIASVALQRLNLAQNTRFQRLMPYAIGGMASFWVFERIASF